MNYYTEEWRNIEDFPGYQVSSEGRVRSFWHVLQHGKGARRSFVVDMEPRILPQSIDDNGYLKVFLIRDGKNYVKKVHKLVAKAFIPNPAPNVLDTVDHIIPGQKGKLNDSVSNLQWMSRGDNIRKAWADGVNENRRISQMRPVCATEVYGDHEIYFVTLRSLCEYMGLSYDRVFYKIRRYGYCEVVWGGTEYFVEYAKGNLLFMRILRQETPRGMDG